MTKSYNFMTYDIVGVLIDDNNIGLYIRPTSSLVECYLQLILRAQLATPCVTSSSSCNPPVAAAAVC